jgi:UDP-N-acetylmuramate--alanine ligase
MEGVTSELLIGKMNLTNKQVIDKAELIEWAKKHQPTLLVMAGAGDIDTLVQPIKTVLENN